jgi:hypothetical protein
MAEQEALLESYRSSREIRLARWRYRQRAAEVATAGKECEDEAAEAVFGEIDEEDEGIIESTPCRDDHEADTSASTAGSEEE